ncbi:hypothetical protein [Glutamicibacter sp. PS]|uniref:hypothetical protein n=1 Tax=Glutamicibacter sp. PS TaxID=3075634 RepID=UPI00284D40CF|nr:hypothetical protein [Glutamicibacter sp. PS]MDR4532431.1 hypothetical protein [Glutamicibacter sp. PS]
MNEQLPNGWVSVRREDREVVGYLEALREDYALVQPRNVLGHVIGDACDYLAGEERLLVRGLSDLTEPWGLADGTVLSILEVSPHGIVLTDRLAAKALLPSARVHVTWPDLEHRLQPAEL